MGIGHVSRSLLAALAAAPLAIAAPAFADDLKVVFPPTGYQTTAEHLFVIGTADPSAPVTINGAPVDRSPQGHFAPTLPLKLGENVWRVASGGRVVTIRVTRLAATAPAPVGLAFQAGSLRPAEPVARPSGERVSFSAIAPEGATVTVLWGGKRIALSPQPAGFDLPENKAGLIFLNQPTPERGVRYEGAVTLGAPAFPAAPVFELSLGGRMLRSVGPATVAVLDPATPAVAVVTADEGVTRSGPSSDYSRLTPQPKGARLAFTATEGAWGRLEDGRWMKRTDTTALPGASVPRSLVKSLRTRASGPWTELLIPLETPVPVTVEEGPHRFTVSLSGVTAQTDIILANDDPLLERLDFTQSGPEAVRYTAWLKSDQAWGYKLRYEGSTLVVSLRQPPVLAATGSPLQGRKIVLDPGHGGDDDAGTTGPTGLHEKDLTLSVARLVRDELARRGAMVTMTRDEDRFVDLGVRTGLIKKIEPDVALSLHYNALPDAGDARNTRGIGAFWFDPVSHSLARQLLGDLTTRLKRPSYGLFWDNLALTRPTVCPAMLLEIGFLTNPEDFEWVSDPASQRQLAIAIADSLERWFSAAGAARPDARSTGGAGLDLRYNGTYAPRGGPMHGLYLVVGLLAALLVLMTLSRRVSVPDPIVLVGGGVLLGLVPGLPPVELAPEVVLLLFLPPLLFADAYTVSWRDFQANLRPISLLAVGLVLATMSAVAWTAHWFLPELNWPTCFLLGAVVAPTDAVAALAIVEKLPIPHRIVTVLVGESLVNDATALVAFRIALTAVLTGAFSWGEAAGRFVLASTLGVGVGLAFGAGVLALRRLLDRDALLENTLFLITPFVAYLAAEQLGCSAVLAVVTAGVFLGRHTARTQSASARLQARGVWDMLTFMLNGLLFVLVGLELRNILQGPLPHSALWLTGVGVMVSLAVIVTRIAWVFPTTYVPRWLLPHLRERDPSPPAAAVAVIAWTGMRGGISLAAALAVPATLGTGAPFSARNDIVFLTFVVIACTLGFQGLTLPPLIRKLGLEPDGQHECEEDRARKHATRAALSRLEEVSRRERLPAGLVSQERQRYEERVRRINDHMQDHPDGLADSRAEAYRHLRHELLEAERRAIIRLRDDGVIGDDVLAHLQRELDLEVLQLDVSHAAPEE